MDAYGDTTGPTLDESLKHLATVAISIYFDEAHGKVFARWVCPTEERAHEVACNMAPLVLKEIRTSTEASGIVPLVTVHREAKPLESRGNLFLRLATEFGDSSISSRRRTQLMELMNMYRNLDRIVNIQTYTYSFDADTGIIYAMNNSTSANVPIFDFREGDPTIQPERVQIAKAFFPTLAEAF